MLQMDHIFLGFFLTPSLSCNSVESSLIVFYFSTRIFYFIFYFLLFFFCPRDCGRPSDSEASFKSLALRYQSKRVFVSPFLLQPFCFLTSKP